MKFFNKTTLIPVDDCYIHTFMYIPCIYIYHHVNSSVEGFMFYTLDPPYVIVFWQM